MQKMGATFVTVGCVLFGLISPTWAGDAHGPQPDDRASASVASDKVASHFSPDAVSSTTSSDKPDLFYWGDKVSYGDETAVFFDPRFWPTDALMNEDTVSRLLAESGATADQQEVLRQSARGLQAFAVGKALFVSVLVLLGLVGAYAVWTQGFPQLPQLPKIQLPFS